MDEIVEIVSSLNEKARNLVPGNDQVRMKSAIDIDKNLIGCFKDRSKGFRIKKDSTGFSK